MNDDLPTQIRNWIEDVDRPIPLDEVRGQSRPLPLSGRQSHAVLAVAAVLLLVVGTVAALARSDRASELETIADPAEGPTTTVPETPTTAPTTTVADGTEESTTTTSAAPTPTPPTTAPPPRLGTVSDVVDPPDGEGCEGLRSRTVWVSTDAPDEVAAPAGGRTDYAEVVTNEGTQTCTMVFERCPGPGMLFTTEGQPAPSAEEGCPAIGHAPTELPPGGSRRDVFTADLHNAPGGYDLRVLQHDGRVASLPIRLEPSIPACSPGAVSVERQPLEVATGPGGTISDSALLSSAQASCTVRITAAHLALRPGGDPGGPERTFTDGAARWYSTDAERVAASAAFGPIDLPDGDYEGTVTLVLESGEALRRPARVLVREEMR